MWPTRRADPAEQLGAYWDTRDSGQTHAAPRTTGLDPALIETIEHLYAHDDVQLPDPRFLNRLETTLMETMALPPTLSAFDAVRPPARDGRTVPAPHPVWPRVVPQLPERHRGRLAALATTALVVLMLAGSFFAFGPGRPDRQGDSPALIPAISGTPATPATPPTAGPVESLWQSTGDPAQPLANPYHLALGPDGNLWIPDAANGRIQILSPDGAFVDAWGSPGTGEGQFTFVHPELGDLGTGAVAFDAAGNIYVADSGNHRIQKFAPDRSFIAAWGEEGTDDGQFRLPVDLAVDEQERIYVVDYLRSDIQVFAADGTHLATWGRVGMDDGEFSGPSGIALTKDGDLWVADTQNHRIQRFAPDGTVEDVWGRIGRGEGQFRFPDDVAIDGQGRILVTEGQNARVQVFDRSGRVLTAWGEPGTDPGQFNGPAGIVLDSEGNVYVTEDGNDRVQKFRVALPLAASRSTPTP